MILIICTGRFGTFSRCVTSLDDLGIDGGHEEWSGPLRCKAPICLSTDKGWILIFELIRRFGTIPLLHEWIHCISGRFFAMFNRMQSCVNGASRYATPDIVHNIHLFQRLTGIILFHELFQFQHRQIPRDAIMSTKGNDLGPRRLSSGIPFVNHFPVPIDFTCNVHIMSTISRTKLHNIGPVLDKWSSSGHDHTCVGNEGRQSGPITFEQLLQQARAWKR
mmetsp:Transcript_8514/g.15432  ORF Transcript_8514/g.15432 Transcript_8514/m.15432 type:complete len:220 (+) Transcript_8514:507-1166(+)